MPKILIFGTEGPVKIEQEEAGPTEAGHRGKSAPRCVRALYRNDTPYSTLLAAVHPVVAAVVTEATVNSELLYSVGSG